MALACVKKDNALEHLLEKVDQMVLVDQCIHSTNKRESFQSNIKEIPSIYLDKCQNSWMIEPDKSVILK